MASSDVTDAPMQAAARGAEQSDERGGREAGELLTPGGGSALAHEVATARWVRWLAAMAGRETWRGVAVGGHAAYHMRARPSLSM